MIAPKRVAKFATSNPSASIHDVASLAKGYVSKWITGPLLLA